MVKRDQLELIHPSGQIAFYDLNPGKGVTNIGRHPDNDIVLDSPEVAPFHAMLDHRQKPYRFMVLSAQGTALLAGQSLPPHVSREVHNWDVIELNGHSLILLEDVPIVEHAPAPGSRLPPPAAPAPPPTPPAAAPGLASTDMPALRPPTPPREVALPDHADDILLAEISGREFTVDVEQRAACQLTLTNGGDIVATFHVEVRGLDYRWVTISPPQVNLFEGERAAVTIAITPPRLPTSRAGAHRFSVVITSPNHPGRSSQISATLYINPYYEFDVDDLSPRQQTLRWRRQSGQAAFSVANHGNSETPFHLDAGDDERGCRFEFQLAGEGAGLTRQVELRLPPGERRSVALRITPLKRRLVGLRNHTYTYSVTTTPLAGQQTPRSILGQLTSTPLIGTWLVVLAAVLLAALLAFIFRPTIQEFSAEPVFLLAGESTALRWRASPFASLRIDPDIGAVEGPAGEQSLTPLDNVTYVLRADNLLSRILPALFGASQEVEVFVGPVLPRVQLSADKTSLITGETATLSWQVTAAEELILTINGIAETIPPSQYKSSRVVRPDSGDTVYTLLARNRYTTAGVTQNVTLKVTPPTATPLPPPVIQRFDVQPTTITAGDKVTLQWSVTGVDKVTLSPLGGDYPPNGTVVVSPEQTTAYVISASNGQREVTLLQEVTVNPAPTPTPVPGTPRIEFFTATPTDVVLGGPQGGSVVLAWSVTGDTTGIEIASADFGRFSALNRQGTLTLTVNKSSQFVLTAANGALTASQTVQVNASVPVPSISGFTIPGVTRRYAFAGDPAFTLTVNGANFVPSSVVRWNGVDHPTTYVSGTQLNVDISASDIASVGQYPITVFNPPPGGGTSPPLNFAVNNPTPTISAGGLSPATTTVGTTRVTVTINGSNFISGSVVRWNGTDRVTTFVSSTQLRIDLSGADLAVVGIFPITVFNPPPLGGISAPAYFSVGNPTPNLTALSPSAVPVTLGGTASTTVVVTGTNFMPTSTVAWKGVLLPSVVITGSTQLAVSIPYTLTSAVDSGPLTVSNPGPGGGTSNPLDFTVSKRSTTTALAASAGSSVFGQPLTFTATISATGGTPAGSVTFRVDGIDHATVGLSGGQAAFSPSPPLVVGNHLVEALYSGDVNFAASTTPAPVNHAVSRAATLVSLAQSPAAPIYGEPLDLVASVSVVAPGAGTPTNVVTFTVDGVPQAPLNLIGGQATFTPASPLTIGSHTIEVTYGGDANFAPSPPTTLTTTIRPVPVIINLSAPAAPPVYGQPVVFTATLSPVLGSDIVTGTITFRVDGVNQASVGLTNGQAAFSTSNLAAGTRLIEAIYTPGMGSIFEANSSSLNQVVYKAGTTTSITYDASNTTATITVSQIPPSTLTPVGTVEYCAYQFAPVYYFVCYVLTLTNGQATAPTLPAPPYYAWAYYYGDSNFNFSYAENPVP